MSTTSQDSLRSQIHVILKRKVDLPFDIPSDWKLSTVRSVVSHYNSIGQDQFKVCKRIKESGEEIHEIRNQADVIAGKQRKQISQMISYMVKNQKKSLEEAVAYLKDLVKEQADLHETIDYPWESK